LQAVSRFLLAIIVSSRNAAAARDAPLSCVTAEFLLPAMSTYYILRFYDGARAATATAMGHYIRRAVPCGEKKDRDG